MNRDKIAYTKITVAIMGMSAFAPIAFGQSQQVCSALSLTTQSSLTIACSPQSEGQDLVLNTAITLTDASGTRNRLVVTENVTTGTGGATQIFITQQQIVLTLGNFHLSFMGGDLFLLN